MAASTAVWLLAVAAPIAAQALVVPSCMPPREARASKVVRADQSGALILADGRIAKLQGLLLPGGIKDRGSQLLQRQALAAIVELTRGRPAILATRSPKEDRYGRIRAQILVSGGPGDEWLQAKLLRRGLARVSIAPDRRECARELYAAEQEARAARRGLWVASPYVIRSPRSLAHPDLGTFQIIEGKVLNAAVSGGRAYLNFGRNWRTDFTVTISPQDMKSFKGDGMDPRKYAGKVIRVRGWIERLNGPEIEVAVPEAIEVLPGSSAAPVQDSAK